MTQNLRLAAISAFAIALLTGSAAYANQKERIGIDNVDMCNQSIRDPECTNDTAMSDDDTVAYTGVFYDDNEDVEDEANVIRRRYQHLNVDGIADSQ